MKMYLKRIKNPILQSNLQIRIMVHKLADSVYGP